MNSKVKQIIRVVALIVGLALISWGLYMHDKSRVALPVFGLGSSGLSSFFKSKAVLIIVIIIELILLFALFLPALRKM